MPALRVYPGTCGYHSKSKKKKSNGQIPLLALLVIFGVISLFSILAFFLALLALTK